MADLPIIWRSDTESAAKYEEARCRIFNIRRPEHFPRAIVKATTLEHIVAAVKLAAEQGVRVVARSGGHGLSAWTLRHNAILIDLQNFKHMSYDEEKNEAQVSPSTLAEELLDFLAERKRFFPAGHTGDIGLGGYLLQGGIGLSCRGYGYACEYVTGVDVVTAEGDVVHADENENADLYWAARGAGPEFPAIVTRFYLKTIPLQPVAKGCRYIWPAVMYDAIFSWIDKISASLDEHVDPSVFGFMIPGINQPGLMFSASVFAQTEEEARRKLAPLVETHPPGAMVAEDFVDSSITTVYAGSRQFNPPGCRYFTDSVFLKPGTDVVEACRHMFTQIPFPRGLAYWQPLRISPARKQPDMALSIQSEHYVSLLAVYDNEAEDEAQTEWVIEGIRKLEPQIHGTFIADAHPEMRTSNYWSEEATARLAAVGSKWDPKGRITGIVVRQE
ncbi:6-hydroxy-D-nicotine oxidase [Escovopsis weberi]|uniref:6-hydroxy-D-nicotine oxidase n=1 Tax=Escovopsis weberi TaxID=150374 RepID=A0A0M8N889_ESCWE|nr:6-hydroxy-D-nicotine oxidase [Escovopsis weberi]